MKNEISMNANLVSFSTQPKKYLWFSNTSSTIYRRYYRSKHNLTMIELLAKDRMELNNFSNNKRSGFLFRLLFRLAYFAKYLRIRMVQTNCPSTAISLKKFRCKTQNGDTLNYLTLYGSHRCLLLLLTKAFLPRYNFSRLFDVLHYDLPVRRWLGK